MIKSIENVEIKNAVDIFLDGFKSQGKADSTITDYSRVLERFMEFLTHINITHIDEINHITVNNFLNHCKEKYKLEYKTKYKYYAFLSNFFTEMYNLNMLSQIPTNRLVMKRPETKDTFFYLNYDEIQKIINVAKEEKKQLRALTDSCFIILLSETGARRSDALSLTWNQIKLHKKEMDIYISKNKKEITIPINESLYNALLELKSYIRPNPYDPVFLSNKFEQLSATTANTYFKKYVKKSNVIEYRIKKIKNSSMPEEEKDEATSRVEVTFHTLKHSFITRCFLEGKTVEEIQALTGNSDRDTLMKYKNMLETDYSDVADTLNKLTRSRTV